jgi:uncharacterized protein YciI
MLRPMRSAPLSALFAAVVLSSCSLFRSAPADRDYTLVYLKTGPAQGLTKDAQQQAFAGHMANMGKLAREGKLVLAGPFGQKRSDNALRGIFVLATSDQKEAQRIAETDPAVQAGVFSLEFHAFRTAAPLSRFLAAELAREDAEKAAGRTPKPGEFGRGYALLIADEFDKMVEAIDGRRDVLLTARFDGTKGVAVLNCIDRVAAEEAFALLRDQLGVHRFEEWFASKGLEQLPSMQ